MYSTDYIEIFFSTKNKHKKTPTYKYVGVSKLYT